jgi:tripartite-type tricarboxylate transporter receptor subunit TctC
LPDLPSLHETVSGVVIDGFFAIVAPVATPPDVIAQLNRHIDQYLGGAEIHARLLALGLDTAGGGTPETTAQTIRKEQERWRAVGKELNVEPQ